MKEFFEVLKEKIKEAKRSLKIASPWVDLCILERLLEALPKDVKVEIILRTEEIKDLAITGEGVFKFLERNQADVYLNDRLHAKLVIVDDTFALVGSANLTGAGMREDGNLEAVVFLEGEKVEKILDLFEDFKKQSTKVLRDTSAVVISVESSTEAIVLLFEDISEQSFLWVEKEDYKLLCKLTKVYTQSQPLNPPVNPFNSKAWILAHIKTSLSKISYMGKVKVLFELRGEKEGYFGTPLRSLNLGDQLLPVRGEDLDLKRIMRTNLSGYPMDSPVRVGSLVGKGIDVYVDLAKLTSMHMAILGTTGSGKTTFVARLVENIPEGEEVKVIIIDLFGEYYNKLKAKRVHYIKIPYTLIPLWTEDIKELFRDYGLVIQEKSEEERSFFAQIRKNLKPSLDLSGYKEKSLREILFESSKGGLRNDVIEVISMLSKELGEEVISNQPQIFGSLKEALLSDSKVLIIDLRDVVNLPTRLNLVGLILKEILSMARQRQERKLIVLEEAHNFAPERGATEVPAGRENLAISMTKKIALEGRKFSLGLLAISQRPANLSKYVLSQLNTQAIFRLITQNDIEAVSQFFEYPQEDQIRLIPSLKPGYLFLSGIGVPFNMLVEIEL